MTHQKPDICIYHGYCPDGFTSAWAVWMRYSDSVEYRHGSYGSPPPSNVAGKHILLVDFSYKQDVLREMAKTAASITILDHHKTSRDDLMPLLEEGLVQGVFDMSKSGAGLAWEWAFPGHPLPHLVKYVQDRDLWLFEHGETTKEFCAALDMYPMEFKYWYNVNSMMQDVERRREREDFFKLGKALRQKHLKNCDHIIAASLHHTEVYFEGVPYRVPTVNCPHIYSSDIGNILTLRPSAPFAMTFYINKEGMAVYSLRSTDDKVDVSEVAKQFGGGGHRNASGFRLYCEDFFHMVD